MKTLDLTRRTHTVADSPIGELTLVATDGALAGLYMEQHRHRPPEHSFGEPDARPFAEAIRQLEEYFAGSRTSFELPLTLAGTEFQRRVWAGLRDIGYGETVSYGQLADRLGTPPLHAPWVWPTERTRSASSCPVIA